MDGNNRWSKKNNKNSYDAYSFGAKKLLTLSSYIFDNYKINYISAFALSKKNLDRSPAIIKTLRKVLENFLNEQNNFLKRNFKICFRGNYSFLDTTTIKKKN